MPKIYGTHYCSNCENEIPWDYHIPNHISSSYYEVFKIEPENYHAKRINSVSSDVIELRVVCDECGQIDDFIYNSDNEE